MLNFVVACAASKVSVWKEMVFPEFTRLAPFALYLSLAIASLWIFHIVRAKRRLFRIPTQVLSIIAGLISGLAFLMIGCGELWDSTLHSQPVFSPDGRSALRVTDVDGGALGGYTYVELFSKQGFLVSIIFRGQWAQADLQHMRWAGIHEVVINYDSDYPQAPFCNAAQGVAVLCSPTPYFVPKPALTGQGAQPSADKGVLSGQVK